MPTAATMAAPSRGRGQDAAVITPTVPFIRASGEHREPTGIDVTRALTTSDQDLGVFDVPAYGYVRSLLVLVEATGGAGTGLTAKDDAPWNALKNIALTEPNGAVLSSFSTGYSCFLANKWGGYRDVAGADLRAAPTYAGVGATSGNFRFLLRIPVELNLRDGLGSLPNQNAAATFKLRLSLAGASQIMNGTPTTMPSVRVRVYLEAWEQPEPQSAGQVNQVTPPAMNTTQFWSEQVYNLGSGQQTVRFTRVGNYLRNLIFILRDASGGRTSAALNWPDQSTIYLDTRPLDILSRDLWTHQMYERSGFGGATGSSTPFPDTARGVDSSVWVYDFTHEFDGTLGRENRDLWMPTLGSTRLELQGQFGAAGSLTVLTNDVAISDSVFM